MAEDVPHPAALAKFSSIGSSLLYTSPPTPPAPSTPRDADGDKTCVVCLVEPRKIRFAPCKHANVCDECALKLIQHANYKELQCPECKTVVEKLESQGRDPGSSLLPPISRQPTFLPSFLDSASTLLTIDEFLETEIAESNEGSARRELAKSAKTHWNDVPQPGEVVWPAALRGFRRVSGLALPQQPWPLARTLVGVLALVLALAYFWGVFVVARAQSEFNEYMDTQGPFLVKVTRLAGFDGPVNVLVPHDRTCVDAQHLAPPPVPCIETYADPTRHQRWWGLVPDDKVGDVTEGVAGIQKARWWFFQVTFWFGSMAIVRPVWSVYRADSSPGMPYISELSNAGIHAMAGMALLSSLYGMFWDGDAQLVIINYVPGWGYVWLLFWSFASLTLVTISVIKQHLGLLVLALSSLLYWLVWLVIPYVGYCWFFAWRYVDAVAWQEQAVLDGANRSDGSPLHVPFSEKVAIDLGMPFAVCAYGGFACWLGAGLISLSSNCRHLHLLETDADYRQAVFIAAEQRGQNQNQQAANFTRLVMAAVTSNAEERAQRQGDEREMV